MWVGCVGLLSTLQQQRAEFFFCYAHVYTTSCFSFIGYWAVESTGTVWNQPSTPEAAL